MTEQIQTDQVNQEQVQDQNEVQPQKNVFETISEATGKNLNSPEAVIKTVTSANEHITKLETEQASQRELINKLLEDKEKSQNAESVLAQLKENKQDVPQVQTLDKDSIQQYVDELLTTKEYKRKTDSNLSEFDSSIKASFGDEAANKLVAKSSEIGMDIEDIKSLATKSPAAALKLLGIDSNSRIQSVGITSSDITKPIEANTKSGLTKFKEDCKARGIKVGSPKYLQELIVNQKNIF